MTVRVRFAPSPTGYLHVGGARTALFNWLEARARGGTFILRSDDTDTERSTEAFQQDILDGMRWLGLDWDEGIEAGGPHEPYRQSRRVDRYRQVGTALLESGAAYYAFETPEELEDLRAAARREGRPPLYTGPAEPVAPAVAAQRVADGEPAVVRFAIPRPGETVFEDVVRGEVRFDHDHVDDFIIMRSDGSPTYHLASTVDDVDFGISHVVRGEDLLSSTPKHIRLGAALAPDHAVTYAHLPLLHGPDGSKLSKRHGDTAVRAYRDAGILPEAMTNYLALLGWSPGDDETVVTRDEMIDRFSLGAVSKNPAIFDHDKLEWLNGVYIRDLQAEDFVARVLPLVEADLGRALSPDDRLVLAQIAPDVQERAKTLVEVPPQVRFLFVDEVVYDETSWQKVMTKEDVPRALDGATAALTGVTDWGVASIEPALRAMLEAEELSARKGLQPIRVAITGSSVSPPLFESLAALGRERSLQRLGDARARLGA